MGYKYLNNRDTGPVLSWAYGPISPLFYLPAVLAASPTVATIIGGAINLISFFLPLVIVVVISLYSAENKFIVVYTIPLIFTGYFWMASNPSLSYSATRIHVDSPSIFLASTACISVYCHYKYPLRKWKIDLLILSAFLSILSIWTKHNVLLIPFAIITYMLIIGKYKDCKRYITYFLGFAAVISLIIVMVFSSEYLYFLMVTSLESVPRYFNVESLRRVILELLDYNKIFLLIISIYLFLTFSRIHRLTSPREWFVSNPLSLFLIVSLYMLPVSLSSRLKWGGDFNSFSIFIYFLMLTTLVILAEIISEYYRNKSKIFPKNKSRLINFIMFLSMMFLILSIDYQYLRLLPNSIDLTIYQLKNNNSLEIAYNYTKKHPNMVYFPDYPLAALMAEGKLYHSMKGLNDREAGNLHLTDRHFREYLPAKLQYVAFLNPVRKNHWQKEREKIVKNYLPEFSHKIDIAELPGWLVYTRK